MKRTWIGFFEGAVYLCLFVPVLGVQMKLVG